MRFVSDDDDVVSRTVGVIRRHRLIEFLNERENEMLVRLGKHRFQLCPAPRSAGVLVVVDDAAACEGSIDLTIEVITVSENEKREVPADMSVHLARKEYDGVRFPCPLCVPEDAELAAEALAVSNGTDREIDSQELLVLGDDLDQRLFALVEQNEILEDVDEVCL